MLINELTKALSQYLNWNRARITCLAQLIQALFVVKTVNLAQLANAFKGKAKTESSYKRIQRFFRGFRFDLSCIAKLVIHMFGLQNQKFILIFDRTNWQFGQAKINILMMAIAYEGIAIPFFWLVLNTKGNSAPKHRISLLNQALKKFGKDKIRCILADREFVGSEWFSFLMKEDLPFHIRIQEKYLIGGVRNGYLIPAKSVFKNIKPGKKKMIKEKVQLWGLDVYLAAGRLEDGKLLIVASNIFVEDPIELYKKRWEIETLFGCLKTRGFRLEDTHLSHQKRIEKLLFVLVIAFCWALKMGNIKRLLKPLPIKNHGRRLFSFFRYGFDEIRRVLFNLKEMAKNFYNLLRIFTVSGITSYGDL
jgi:hypothetical protein